MTGAWIIGVLSGVAILAGFLAIWRPMRISAREAKFAKTFKHGMPSWPYKQWKTGGKILKSGKKWGEYANSINRRFDPRRRMHWTIQIFLTTPSGQIELERYKFYQ